MNRGSVATLIVAACAAACGQLLLKLGAQHRAHLVDFLNLPIGFGLLLYALGTALWIYVLSSEKLITVYAFSALTLALVYAGALLVLGESLSMRGACGLGLVLAGLYLIAV